MAISIAVIVASLFLILFIINVVIDLKRSIENDEISSHRNLRELAKVPNGYAAGTLNNIQDRFRNVNLKSKVHNTVQERSIQRHQSIQKLREILEDSVKSKQHRYEAVDDLSKNGYKQFQFPVPKNDNKPESIVTPVVIPTEEQSPCNIYKPNSNSEIQPHIVLVFVDTTFMTMFFNWLYFYQTHCGHKQGMKQLVLVCMDQTIATRLEEKGLICSNESFYHQQKHHRKKLTAVWLKRLEIINNYLMRNVSLLLSDTDAVWLKNPYPELNNHMVVNKNNQNKNSTTSDVKVPSSIIATRGWWPFSMSQKWGSALCMGFIYIHADTFTQQFYLDILRHMLFINEKMKRYDEFRQEQEQNKHIPNYLRLQQKKNNNSIDNNDNFESFAQSESLSPDDQFSLNYILQEILIQWSHQMSMSLDDAISGKSYQVATVAYKKMISFDVHEGSSPSNNDTVDIYHNQSMIQQITAANLKRIANQEHFVTILPHRSFIRNCLNLQTGQVRTKYSPPSRMYERAKVYIQEATVAHCLVSTGSQFQKRRFLQYYDLWKL